MAFKTPHPIFQTTDTFQQLVDDLNTYGNTVDSDLGYVDSAIGPDAGSGFYLNGLLTTSGNLIDAINELDSDLHGVGGGTYKTLTTTEAKTVVGSINEIEAVFDASASTIDTTSGLTVTSAGTETHNITGSFNVNASSDATIDVDGDINLDADGQHIRFKDAGTTRLQYTMGTTNTVASTGNYTVDATGDITLDADGNDIFFKDGAATRLQYTMGSTNTVTSTGNYTVDASGDITLDANGDDIMFRDGASQRVKFSLAATNTVAYTGNLTETVTGAYSQTATSYSSNVGTGVYNTTSGNQTHTVGGTHQINATGTISHTSGGAFNITANGGSATIDASGDIILDADGNDLIFKNGGGADQVTHSLSDAGAYVVTYPAGVTHTQTAGDLEFNVAGKDVTFTDGTTERFRLNLDAAPNLYMTGTSASISNSAGNIRIVAASDVEMDAATGNVTFDQNNIQYAAIYKSGSNVIFRLAANATGFTVNSTNLTVPGEITLPSSGTGTITSSEISANTVHGAIDEVNARIPNVYNRAGTLLNP